MFGFLGPNGAGKTTAVKLLLGLARPTRRPRHRPRRAARRPAARRRIGYLPGAVPLPAVAPRPRGPRAPRPARRRRSTGRGPRSTAILDEVGLARPRRPIRVGGVLEGHAAAARARRRAARLAGARDPRRADVRARPGRPGRRPGDHPPSPRRRHDGLPELAPADRGRARLRPRRDRRPRPRPRERPPRRPARRSASVRIRATDLPADGPGRLAGSAASLRPTTTAGSRSPASSTTAIPDVVAAIVAAGGRVHAVDPGRATLEDRYFELITGRARRRTRGEGPA